MPKNLKSSLLDLKKELGGELLEDTFQVGDHQFTMRLLNEEETSWCYQYVNMGSVVSMGTSMRLPTLSMGIRAIDGISLLEYFSEDWEKLDKDERAALLEANPLSQKYFIAGHMMDFLGDCPPDMITKIWKQWETLVSRRADAQENLKNSSGEDSEKEESESSTESSQPGEAIATAVR